ncbi:MAG: hypothetical protein AB7I18_09115 [Candidatus Berkiella sp.]
MTAPKKAKKHLEHALTDLSHWITHHSGNANQPKDQSVKNIGAFAKRLEKQIAHFVDGLVSDSSSHNVAAQFKARCDSTQQLIAEALLSKDHTQTAVNALKQLHKTIVDALYRMSQVFKDLFKSTTSLEKMPSFTPHHGTQVVHLKNENSFKKQQSRGSQDALRHYNIPKGKNG